MNSSLNKALIETTVRNSIKQIKNDPERNMRNLIDMALSFSKGRFQKHFLESAQTMLKKENSCYYKIIPDLIANTDEERIVTVGMNIGYNSCTLGAQKIRETEANKHFDIPWTVSLEIDSGSYQKNIQHYLSLLLQGKELGIYTWNIHVPDTPVYLFELAEANPECTFNIFCTPEAITPALLDDAKEVNNIVFIIKYSDNMAETCSLLRSQKFLYAIYYNYENESFNSELFDEIMSDTENAKALFTIFISGTALIEDEKLYKHIQQVRAEQTYLSIPFDFRHDICYIDSIISDNICTIGFRKDGTCYSLDSNTILKNHNIFNCTLCDILNTLSHTP